MSVLTPEQKEERTALVIEVMALAYLLHENSEHCVFIDFSGHVDSLKVDVRESKKKWQTALTECDFYTHGRWEKSGDDVNYWLKVKRDVLKNALESREISTENMDRVVTEMVSYAF